MVALGLPDGMLGVAWPSMRRGFGLGLDAIGAWVVAWTAGSVLASTSCGSLLGRFGLPRVLSAAALAFAGGLGGVALAPSWPAAVALAGLAGAGAGATDAALNAWGAVRRDAAVLSWLHTCYGVGASAGPALLTGLFAAGLEWQSGYVLAALVWLGLALAARRRPLASPPAARTGGGPSGARPPLGSPALWLSLGTFLVYVGLEVIAGLWAYTVLVDSRGMATVPAGSAMSAFWAVFTGGRLLAGFLARRVPLLALLRAALALQAAGALAFALGLAPALDVAGLLVLGLGLAPVFPVLMATTARHFPIERVGGAAGLQVTAATLGAAIGPAGAGLLAARAGLESVGLLLAAGVVLLAALVELRER